MYMKNAWYVAAAADEITRAPAALTILEEPIVMYRTQDGEIAALEDACPHRKLPLSMGRVKGDAIECGYHGLQFDRAGRCIEIPCQARIPNSAHIRAYPVVERYDLIWIWMGEAESADPSLIPHAKHYGDPDWGISRGAPIDIDCNYLLITDNLLDPSHVVWVHPTSFAASGAADTPLQVDADDTGVHVHRWIMGDDVAPLYQPLVPFEGKCDRYQSYAVSYPCHALTTAYFAPAGKGGDVDGLPEDSFIMYSYNFMTPIDAGRSRYYYFQIRNVAPESAKISTLMANGVRAAFMEDKAVLEACQVGLERTSAAPINLSIDAGPMRFRQRLEKIIDAESARTHAAA